MQNLSILKSYTPLERQCIEAARLRADDGGIHGHSMARSFIIFSVKFPDRFIRWALYSEMGFKPLRGCYERKIESAFITNEKHLPKVLPFLGGEKTVLFLRDYNAGNIPRAYLKDMASGDVEDLGLFSPANESYALTRSSWTYDPSQRMYFVTDLD